MRLSAVEGRPPSVSFTWAEQSWPSEVARQTTDSTVAPADGASNCVGQSWAPSSRVELQMSHVRGDLRSQTEVIPKQGKKIVCYIIDRTNFTKEIN